MNIVQNQCRQSLQEHRKKISFAWHCINEPQSVKRYIHKHMDGAGDGSFMRTCSLDELQHMGRGLGVAVKLPFNPWKIIFHISAGNFVFLLVNLTLTFPSFSRQVFFRILPKDCHTLSYNLYPLVPGYVKLPTMQLTLPQAPDISKETTQKMMPSHIFIKVLFFL